MITSTRKPFFILDIAILYLILGRNILRTGNINNIYVLINFIISIIFYISALTIFSAFFLHINIERNSFRENIKALGKGTVVAIICSIIVVYLFYKPYRQIFVYHNLIVGAMVFVILSFVRTIEWKFFWPHNPIRLLFLGGEGYNKYYLEDIFHMIKGKSNFIYLARPANTEKYQQHHDSWSQSQATIKYVDINEAVQLIKGRQLSAVVFGTELLKREFLDLIPLCYQNGCSVIDIPHFYELICKKVPLFKIGENWLVHTSFRKPPLDQLFVKRVFDIVVSAVLLLLLFPFCLIIAFAIKLESKGPALFIQERSGLGGKTFRMIKFRSMRLHPDDSNQWPRVAVDLITPLGKFLRKTGLDEVPQLINILRGEMSFVGPRPARPLVTQRHIEVIPFFAISLALRPGITGWAQLHQGTDTGDESLMEKVRYALYYAKNYSLLFDLEILVKTARLAFLRTKPGRAKLPHQVST